MAAWQFFLVLLAVGTTVLADPLFTFPEIAREASTRIVSGWQAEEGQIPYQISIRMVNPAGAVSSCGGSILSAEWGLTAAHCTAGRTTIVVRAGLVNLTTPAYIFETTKYYNHPLYNEALPGLVQPHDIGLLEFPLSLTFSKLLQPIRLHNSADMNRNYEGEILTASGWGLTWTQGTAPENLNWVLQRGVSNQECSSAYGGSNIIVASTICSRYYNVTSQSTCQGDSGGPLTVIDRDGQISQVGVASFVSGTGCHTNFPAGFIRPGHYHEWYTQVSGKNFDWEFTPESSESSESAPAESSESAPSESSESAPVESSESAPSESSESAPAESSESAPAESSESAPAESSESAPAESSESAPAESSESAPTESSESAPAESSESAPAESSESSESAQSSVSSQSSEQAPPSSSSQED